MFFFAPLIFALSPNLVEGTIGNILFSSYAMDNGRLVFCNEFYEG